MAALAVLGVRFAKAEGMKYLESAPMYQSEGSNPVAFNVTCATATWTIIIASDTISRSTLMESIPANTQTICLLPGTTSTVPNIAISSQCMSSTGGIQLIPSYGLTDYSRAAWFCASSSGTVSGTITGYRTRDKRDYGSIGAAGLQ